MVAEGVSSAPQSVTLMQTINLTRHQTGASTLCKHFGCGITVCDVGVNADIHEPAVVERKIAYGTGNIARGPAMIRQQAEQAIRTGIEMAQASDADVLGVGEMGIGNTTTSAAVLAVLLDRDPDALTGRGGGITDEGFVKKKQVIKTAIEVNRPDCSDPIDVLAKVGGFDIAAMCGAFIGAALTRRPVVIDGFISAVAALCACRLCPHVRGYLIPSHASYEVGYRAAMDAMGLCAFPFLVTGCIHLDGADRHAGGLSGGRIPVLRLLRFRSSGRLCRLWPVPAQGLPLPRWYERRCGRLRPHHRGAVRRGGLRTDLRRKTMILIMQDIFCGVVPMGAENRRWRQNTGRLAQYLSAEAVQVSRIFCGLEQRLK